MKKVAYQADLLQNDSSGRQLESPGALPDGNHGDNRITMQPQNVTPSSERNRLSVDLSPVVSSHLDHISEVTGQSKSAIIAAALLEALPALLGRADALKKRHQELAGSRKK